MIELHLLGGTSLAEAGGTRLQGLLAQPRRFALLAYLAAAVPRGPRRRDHLLPLFWPDLDQDRARAALRQALHVVRRELGSEALQSLGAEEVGLDFDRVRCDVAEFERAIGSGRHGAALEIYRGPLLDGFFIPDAPEFERWLEGERARLQEAATASARTLVARCEAEGDLATATQWARRASRLAPLDEGLLRRLMELLDRLGDRAAALAVYEELAQRLAQDLETEPSAETQGLRAAILARETTLDTPPARAQELVPRLRAALARRYRVEREIAAGAVGTVCLAHDLRHDRPVAIKVLRPEVAAVVTAERFLREIQTAARLRHPRIVTLLDSGEAGGLLYFVMPYLSGESLRERLARERQIPIADAIRIARDVAEALEYAHGQGFIHRDIKPENILLENGRATLADFGIAVAISTADSERLTQTGIAVGSPAYMSPEQAGGVAALDGRSDLYGLACVLYEMLAGAPPFTGPTPQAMLARHAMDPVPPIRTVRPAIPGPVERAVLQALAKVPADRQGSAAEFIQALDLQDDEPHPDIPAPMPRAPQLRRALGAGLALAGGLALLTLLNVSRQPGRSAPPPATPDVHAQAHDLFLQGRTHVRHENPVEDSIGIALLERAVTLDPSFADAYAELSHAYALRATQFAPEDSEAGERAALDRDKALALDPNLAMGHFAQAFLLWKPLRQFNHELAIQEDRRALALDPNLPEAHHHLGMIYLHLGLLDSAIAEFRTTLRLDPEEGFAQQRIGIALVYQGRYEEGLETFRKVPERFNPALWHYQVAWALLYLGRDGDALALIEQYLRDHPKDRGGVVTAARAILDAKRGDVPRAEADIAAAIRKGAGYQHFHHTAYSIAMAYALLHRPTLAVRFLREAADQGLPCYPCFKNDPYLASIRHDPGFTALMQDLASQRDHWSNMLAGSRMPP